MNTEVLQHFVEISKFAGERFDLIQAGGGNSSVKLDDNRMLIKASGHLLSNVSKDTGYVAVDNLKVIDILENPLVVAESDKRKRENKASELIKKTIIDSNGDNRPSIETFLHVLLYTYTLHTHPIAVNMLTCRKDWKERLIALFPNALFVAYETPGIDLAIELKKECVLYQEAYGYLPKVIFLQNHGLIISSNDPSEIQTLTDEVVQTIENALGINLTRYKLVNEVTQMMKANGFSNVVSMLSEDMYIAEILKNKKERLEKGPLCPDTLVFCGYRAVIINDEKDLVEIQKYYDEYSKYPKIVVFKDFLFFVADSLKKAKEAEEVFKFHLMTLEQIGGQGEYLSLDELKYLDNWEAEKFRQKI